MSSGPHLSGGLRIDYGDFVSTTDEATFTPDKDLVNAPGQVQVAGQGLTVTGVGLTGHPNERNFTLLESDQHRGGSKEEK